LARQIDKDGEPRRPLSPTSFNTNRVELMKTEINKNGHDDGENHACSSLLSPAKADFDDNPPTLLFGRSAFGAVPAKPQPSSREENDVKAVVAAQLATLADQSELENDDILSDFSEKTESITSFGCAGGDSMASLVSKTAATADSAATMPEAQRLKKRKEPNQQPIIGDGGNGSTTNSSAAPKRRRVSALMSDSLASLGPVTSTTKNAKGNTGKQRTARKNKEQKSQKAQQQQHGHQTTLAGWVKK
jgi:hypothetical protein